VKIVSGGIPIGRPAGSVAASATPTKKDAATLNKYLTNPRPIEHHHPDWNREAISG
jgi:hypothetical protein